jgi:hypothetical protein
MLFVLGSEFFKHEVGGKEFNEIDVGGPGETRFWMNPDTHR